MIGPSNIKIQKTGAKEIGNGHARLPASDLERYAVHAKATSGKKDPIRNLTHAACLGGVDGLLYNPGEDKLGCSP